MKPISYDSDASYDDPNLLWGDPSVELEPGDPGYVPAPGSGAPARKTAAPRPSRFSADLPTPSDLPPNGMSTTSILYYVNPNPQNPERPFRVRVQCQGTVAGDQIVAEEAAAAGIEVEKARDFLHRLAQRRVAEAARGCATSEAPDGIRTTPVLGGSYTDSNPGPDQLLPNLSIAFISSPELDAALQQASISFEKKGETSGRKPSVASVTIARTGEANSYKSPGTLVVQGSDFRESRRDEPWAKVYLENEDGTGRVELTVNVCTPTEINASVPASQTGLKRLIVEAGYDENALAIYDELLTKIT